MYRKIGKDVRISNLVDIKYPDLVELNNHIAIDSFFVCSTQLSIGNYVHISPHVGIIGGKNSFLKMNDFSFISHNCSIICGGEKFYGKGLVGPFIPIEYRDDVEDKPIYIEKYAGICANSTILSGSVISEGSIIGAHSLVLKNTITEPWTIYGGNPIKKICKRESKNILEYSEKIII